MDKRAMEVNAFSAFPEKLLHGVSYSFLQMIVDRNDIKALGTTSSPPGNAGGFRRVAFTKPANGGDKEK
jgi:hypothetical protein